jgi:hypothetical protein
MPRLHASAAPVLGSSPRLQSWASVLGSSPGLQSSTSAVLLGPVTQALAVLLGSVTRPQWCSCLVPSSALAVLGALALPRCSSSALCLRLGAPHKTFGLTWPRLGGAPPWLLGHTLVLPLGSSVLRTKAVASVPLLGSLIW